MSASVILLPCCDHHRQHVTESCALCEYVAVVLNDGVPLWIAPAPLMFRANAQRYAEHAAALLRREVQP